MVMTMIPPTEIAPTTPLGALPLAVVDVETTGLYAESGDRVIEVAVLRAMPGRAPESWSVLIDPERPIPAGASAVNGITHALLAGAPRFADVAEAVAERLDGAVLLAHNASFDLSFLAAEFALAGVDPPSRPALCTLTLARRKFRFASNALGNVARAFGVPASGAHRAEADVRMTLAIWQHMQATLIQRGVRTLGDAERAQGGPLRLGAPAPGGLPEPLGTALREGRSVVIRYGGGPRSETLRLIQPRAAGRGMLVAYCHLRRDERTFRVDRILEARWPEPGEGFA